MKNFALGLLIVLGLSACQTTSINKPVTAGVYESKDSQHIAQARMEALDVPIGQKIHWVNRDNGHYGHVVSLREAQNEDGQYCREYQEIIVLGGKERKTFQTVCQKDDGSW